MRPAPALLILSAAGLSAACKRPPTAPSSLDDLSGYLYEHLKDEDPAAMQAGLENLAVWLQDGDNLDLTFEGYEVSQLTEDTVDSLDDKDRSIEGLVGAAVGTEGEYGVQGVTETLVLVQPEELAPDMYNFYDREFITDPDCFIAHDCEFLDVYNSMESTYAGILDVKTDTNGEYRWVDMEAGTAMVQRTWLEDSAELSLDWLGVDEQYYLNVVMPTESGGSLRLQATWVVATMGDGAVPEGTALSLVIGSMQTMYDSVDAWLADHDESTTPDKKKGCATVSAPSGGLAALLLSLGLVGWRRRR